MRCARSMPQPRERSHPRRASRPDAFGRAEDQLQSGFGLYAMGAATTKETPAMKFGLARGKMRANEFFE